ncbi:MAG: serine/threonine-protein kinase [Kofleriaceae bacterium]
MRVGRYEIERRLGGGGMAEVFRARLVGNEGFSRPVAIKRVLPHFAADPAFVQMFVSEAQLCAKLQHPNIVSVVDFDRDEEGRPYLVLELVDGVDLSRLLEKGPLPPSVAIHVATEVLRGLEYAHGHLRADDARGVVHRDLSPHNVLVSWDGTVKVSDFGIAKALIATNASASTTLKGKPSYMSPEQANGEPLDERSDLFAVGVVLWELLVGRALFGGQTTEEMLSRVLFAPIPSVQSFLEEVPRDLDRVVMKLLARDRTERFHSAGDALESLLACEAAPRDGREQLVDTLCLRFPEHMKPSGAARTAADDPRPAPRTRRRPVWYWLAGGLLLGLLTGGISCVRATTSEPTTSSKPP